MHFTEYLSRRRGELLGIAALVVIFAHSYAELPIRGWNYLITRNAPMVIDFFVILAAMGAVYSLEKRPDATTFMLRRLRRILPAYYVGVVLYALAGGIDTVQMLAAHIVPICTWTEKYWSTYWYISATLAYYLMMPLIYHAIKHARCPRLMAALLWNLTVFVLPLCTQETEATIALMRFHSVVTGTALGVFHFTHTEKKDRIIDFIGIVILYLLGFALMTKRGLLSVLPIRLWDDHQIGYLHKGLRAPLVAVVITFALDWVQKTPLKFINAALRWIGAMSLETYMVHIPLRHVLYYKLGIEGIPLLGLLLVISLPAAWGLAWLCKKVKLPGDKEKRSVA